jgi:hypothetical protein
MSGKSGLLSGLGKGLGGIIGGPMSGIGMLGGMMDQGKGDSGFNPLQFLMGGLGGGGNALSMLSPFLSMFMHHKDPNTNPDVTGTGQ